MSLLKFNRRQLIAGAALSAGSVALGRAAHAEAPADAGDPSMERLLAPGSLPDIWIGPSDAKVSIVEYASMTCSHCARFHKDTLPHVKKLIDDGKSIRFTLREFPLDPLATAAFMLARATNDKRDAFIDTLFANQAAWAFDGKPLETLPVFARQAGMSQEKFDAVLKDQALFDAVNQARQRAANEFKVKATPTFFINGRRHAGMMTVAEFDAAIAPHL